MQTIKSLASCKVALFLYLAASSCFLISIYMYWGLDNQLRHANQRIANLEQWFYEEVSDTQFLNSIIGVDAEFVNQGFIVKTVPRNYTYHTDLMIAEYHGNVSAYFEDLRDAFDKFTNLAKANNVFLIEKSIVIYGTRIHIEWGFTYWINYMAYTKTSSMKQECHAYLAITWDR